jgi:hypothetical protein
MAEIYVCVRFQDDSVAHVALQTVIRTTGGLLIREWTDVEIVRELSRSIAMWAADQKFMVAWRRISAEEHRLFDRDPAEPGERRWYRNALTDDGQRIVVDMGKAKALHRDRLRHFRSTLLDQLDREWMRATGMGNPADAARIEGERRRLRDLPQDPAIERATSVVELIAHFQQIKG